MTTVTTTTTVSRRFAGPPFAVNGGYIAGLLAERADLRAAHVRLAGPVPFETPIEIRSDDPGASLLHRGRLLATAAPASLLDRSHPRVDFVSAALAAGSTDPSGHPFPSCFVCGPDRSQNDGLHLFPGHVAADTVAVPWRPAAWQGDPLGTLPVRMVTAALDCPSAFPFVRPGVTALLASMTFQIDRLPRVGEDLVAIGWSRGVDGRKFHGASAVATADGESVARAATLWVEVGADDLGRLAESTTRSAP